MEEKNNDIELFQKMDEGTFTKYYKELTLYARFRGRQIGISDKDIIYDIVANTFIEAIERTKIEGDEIYNLHLYLRALVDRQMKKYRFNEIPFSKIDPPELDDIGKIKSEISSEYATDNPVDDFLENLPLETRNILKLKYYEGYNSKEIATILNISVAHISRIIGEARIQINRRLYLDDK